MYKYILYIQIVVLNIYATQQLPPDICIPSNFPTCLRLYIQHIHILTSLHNINSTTSKKEICAIINFLLLGHCPVLPRAEQQALIQDISYRLIHIKKRDAFYALRRKKGAPTFYHALNRILKQQGKKTFKLNALYQPTIFSAPPDMLKRYLWIATQVSIFRPGMFMSFGRTWSGFVPSIKSLEELYRISASEHTNILDFCCQDIRCIDTLARVFSCWENVETLDISHNRISRLESGILKGLCNLKVLKLMHNNISFIAADVFNDTPLLTHIVLNNNKLVAINNEFSRLSFLCWLDLCANQIEYIRDGAFCQSQYMEILMLSHNKIRAMQSAVADLSNLQRLTLDHNNIEHFNKNHIKACVSLRHIELHANPLLSLEEETFNHCCLHSMSINKNIYDDKAYQVLCKNHPNIAIHTHEPVAL